MTIHEFLVDTDGCLGEAAEHVIDIRNYIESLPETSATFKLKDIPNIYPSRVRVEHIEFAKSWLIPPRFTEGKSFLCVNPTAKFAHRYTDITADCRCGSTVARKYNTDTPALDGVTEHADDCMKFYRQHTRADLSERRYDETMRLTKIGWGRHELGRRFACEPSQVNAMVNQYGVNFGDLRDEFRRIAANTYCYFVRERGYGGQKIADIYGYTRDTLARWINKHGDYEPEKGDLELTRDNDGLFVWELVKKPNRPDWMKKARRASQ